MQKRKPGVVTFPRQLNLRVNSDDIDRLEKLRKFLGARSLSATARSAIQFMYSTAIPKAMKGGRRG